MTTNLIGRICEFRDNLDSPFNGTGTIVAVYQRLPSQFVHFLIETTNVPAGRLLERQMEFVRMVQAKKPVGKPLIDILTCDNGDTE